MHSRLRWHFGQSAHSGPFHEKSWMTLIVNGKTFSGGHQEDSAEHNKIPEIDTKEKPQFSGCSAEHSAHERHRRSHQKQWKSSSEDDAVWISCQLPQISEQKRKSKESARCIWRSVLFFAEKLISRDAYIHSMVRASLIFIPGPYMKNARPARSGRHGGHFEFRSGTQNHWKTPTWLQCKLPGQPELPSIAVKLEMPLRMVRNQKGQEVVFTASPPQEDEQKKKSHWPLFYQPCSLKLPFCDTACQALCFGSYQTRASQLHHWHTHTHTRTHTDTGVHNTNAFE